MSEQTTAYPICWPAGWKRMEAYRRSRASFGKVRQSGDRYRGKQYLTVSEATQQVLKRSWKQERPRDASDLPTPAQLAVIQHLWTDLAEFHAGALSRKFQSGL